MPDLTWRFEENEEITLADNKIVAINGVLRLSPLNDDLTNWSYRGKYHQSSAILYTKTAEAVTGIYGFFAEIEENGGSVGFRISSDGGVTWWGWSGGWVSGGPFTSMEDIDANISSWAWTGDRQFAVQVEIIPVSSQDATPIVKRVSIFAEMPFGFIEDIERSLSTFLKTKVRVPLRYGVAGTGLTSADIPDPAVIHQPIKVYNLDTDPGKLTNLFASLVGRTVNFTIPQNGRVLIEYSGQVPVHIETDEDFQIADRLAFIIRTPAVTEARVMRDDGNMVEPLLGGRDLGWGTKPFAMVAGTRGRARRGIGKGTTSEGRADLLQGMWRALPDS
jgi:hypothetical protein